MDYKEWKAIVEEILTIEKMIRDKQSCAEALMASLMPRAIQYDTEKVQTSPRDYMLEVFAKIDDLNDEVDELAEAKTRALMKVSDLIDTIPNAGDREIVRAMFMEGKSKREVAKTIHYSEAYVYKHMREGVKGIESL